MPHVDATSQGGGSRDGASAPSAAPRTAQTPRSGSRDGASAPSAYPTRKRRPRMPSFDYRGQFAYHVVLTTNARANCFGDEPFARQCIERLTAAAERCGFRLLAFCFMPDHVHILVLGDHDAADLVRFVQRFKQTTAVAFRRSTKRALWQQSFYDRLLRADEDLASVADYIFGNPLLAGLADDARRYRFSGGEYFVPDGAEAPSLLHAATSGAGCDA